MPLNTQIKRNGKARKVRWSDFHVTAMVYASTIDSGEGPFEDNAEFQRKAKELMEEQGCIAIDGATAWEINSYHVIGASQLNSGDYVMKNVDLVFHDNMDGEKFEIKKGDVLSAWRSM